MPSKLPQKPFTPPLKPLLQPISTQGAALTRRRQAIGLLLLALAILIVVLLRAPAHFLFPTGWWRF